MTIVQVGFKATGILCNTPLKSANLWFRLYQCSSKLASQDPAVDVNTKNLHRPKAWHKMASASKQGGIRVHAGWHLRPKPSNPLITNTINML